MPYRLLWSERCSCRCCGTAPARLGYVVRLDPGLEVVSPWIAEDCKEFLKVGVFYNFQRSTGVILVHLRAAIREPIPAASLENEMMYGASFPVSAEVLSDNFVLRPTGSRAMSLCTRTAE